MGVVGCGRIGFYIRQRPRLNIWVQDALRDCFTASHVTPATKAPKKIPPPAVAKQSSTQLTLSCTSGAAATMEKSMVDAFMNKGMT